jgi:hypothetical protein
VHRRSLYRADTERLVAQHRAAVLDRATDVVVVQERWRVHADQIDVVTRTQRRDLVLITR